MKVFLCYSEHFDYNSPSSVYLNKVVSSEELAKEWVEFMTPKIKSPYSSNYYYEEYEVESTSE